MKNRRNNNLTHLAIATALIAAVAGMVTASEPSTTNGNAIPRVIQLHAPNNATPSVTIWTPKTASRVQGEHATAKPAVPKVIELHAPNNATPSMTVWTRE